MVQGGTITVDSGRCGTWLCARAWVPLFHAHWQVAGILLLISPLSHGEGGHRWHRPHLTGPSAFEESGLGEMLLPGTKCNQSGPLLSCTFALHSPLRDPSSIPTPLTPLYVTTAGITAALACQHSSIDSSIHGKAYQYKWIAGHAGGCGLRLAKLGWWLQAGRWASWLCKKKRLAWGPGMPSRTAQWSGFTKGLEAELTCSASHAARGEDRVATPQVGPHGPTER